jgi:hypothetical protein
MRSREAIGGIPIPEVVMELKRSFVRFSVFVVSTVLLWNGAVCGAQNVDEEIRELNRKQEEALNEGIKAVEFKWSVGVQSDENRRELEELYSARLRLADTPAKRMQYLQEFVKYAKRECDHLDGAFRAGTRGPSYIVFHYRALCLQLRAELLKEEQKQARKDK